MEIFGFSTLIMVLGMAIVFIGLTVLIVVVDGVSRVINKRAPKADASPINVGGSEETFVEDPSLVAVISAALAACLQSDRPLAVQSIRRIAPRQASAWAQAGRRDLMS